MRSALLPLMLGALASVGPHAAAEEIKTTRAAVAALAAPVEVDLDPAAIPTIRGGSREDVVRAEGWMHARDRFLQMDLARRQISGELGELFPEGLALDRSARPLGMRAVARAAVERLPADDRALLAAYADGVNARLESEAPLEYRMLRVSPAPWRPEDTLLVQLGMAKYLDSSAEADLERAGLFATLAPDVARFLAGTEGALSMSVDGSALPAAMPLPAADRLDLRRPRGSASGSRAPSEANPGSNAFAVAGSRTVDGRAIVGNDMHLMLTAPGIWYRVVLEWPGGSMAGLSLPGVPLIVQGTNGAITWAFTNLTADLSDLLLLEIDPDDPGRYLTTEGSQAFEIEEVTLGRAPRTETLTIRRSRFGPVIGTTPDGRALALRWLFHDPTAIDCGLFRLADARSLEEALDAARDWHGPPQNFLVGDGGGRIGWTIAGSLPDRDLLSPAPLPARLAPAWRGVLDPMRKPRIVDPESGVLTSGNQLAIRPDGPLAASMGFTEAPGDRAFRMRELISARRGWTEAELHGVQLDTYSHRLIRWRDAIVALVPDSIDDETARAARAQLVAWNGFVEVDACAPEILDACRRALRQQLAGALGTEATTGMSDEAMLRMLESRAPHLAPDPKGDWNSVAQRFLVRAASETRVATPEPAAGPRNESVAFRTRGDSNISLIRHPAADSLGPAARIAEMPRVPLPGHPTCVRVQTPAFGASERSVISPAHPRDAILVTPAGQAGMPTSPHFRDLHAAWQRGQAFPYLPRAATERIELVRALPKSEPETGSR